MYSITVQNSTGEYVLHNTYDEDFKLNSPVLQLELNKSGTLTFGINPDHPSRAQILPMASEIYVYDDNEVFWIGRPLSIEGDFDMMATVTCEGILGYLLDTQVPPFNFTEGNSIKGTDCVRQFLQRLVTMHNSRVGNTGWNSKKRFTLGTVTVMDSNDNLARSSEDYKSTLETINEKLIETHGGFLRLRISGSTRYIDYIETFGAATQAITFGENLLDLSTHVRAESIYTCVIPEGAQIEGTDTRLTLAGYSPTDAVRSKISQYTHGGAIFWNAQAGYFPGYYAIRDAAGEAAHGRIFIRQTWDDVTKQENLALKAAQYIGTVSVLGTTIELSAVDLSRISVDYKRFNLGEMVQVISIPHGINAEYQISKMTIDLANPANSSMVLGGDLGTFTFENTKQVAEISQKITDDIPAAIQNATTLLSGGLGGYLIIRQDDNGQPYEILIMNAATESAATRCVRINKNGIGFGTSSAGSTNWSYRNAWTIDGNLVADFITTGILKDAYGNMSWNLANGAINAKQLSINSTNFKLDTYGNITAKNATLYGSLESESGARWAKLSGGRMEMRYNGSSVGYIGSSRSVYNQNGIDFDLNSGGAFMAWSVWDGSGYAPKLLYQQASGSTFTQGQLHVRAPLNMGGYTIYNAKLDGGRSYSGTLHLPTSIASDGTVDTWVNVKLQNGIMVSP